MSAQWAQLKALKPPEIVPGTNENKFGSLIFFPLSKRGTLLWECSLVCGSQKGEGMCVCHASSVLEPVGLYDKLH